ncbi:MAG: PLP-dependent aminotransferase family protein [Clostridia bacterium]|nr:PLP-dependent aminotransferase family protein [Clostridia bacterium]
MDESLRSKSPLYLQVYLRLREEITRGERRPGDKLPGRRQLAREENVSIVTVEHSLELLCQEGYVEARPKSGYYVIYRRADSFIPGGLSEASVPAPAPDPDMPASSEPSEEFPFPTLARTMRRVLTEYGERILRKTSNSGAPELREALCRYLGRNRGIHVRPDQIVIGAGAEYLYGLIGIILGQDRLYAIESPSYAKIRQVYEARGIRCDLLPLGRDGIRPEALERTRATVLHITPFRSYPSGVTASATRRSDYLRWADREDRYIVEDDFESEFSLLRKPEETVFARASRENVLYLNTFSRTFSPALRVGYLVLPRRLLPVFQSRAGFFSCTVPTFEQYVLTELLNSGDFERHINRVRRGRRKASASVG